LAAIASINSGQVMASPFSLSTRAAAVRALSFLAGVAATCAFFSALITPVLADLPLETLFKAVGTVFFALIVFDPFG
jgi:hypothetical protein